VPPFFSIVFHGRRRFTFPFPLLGLFPLSPLSFFSLLFSFSFSSTRFSHRELPILTPWVCLAIAFSPGRYSQRRRTFSFCAVAGAFFFRGGLFFSPVYRLDASSGLLPLRLPFPPDRINFFSLSVAYSPPPQAPFPFDHLPTFYVTYGLECPSSAAFTPF